MTTRTGVGARENKSVCQIEKGYDFDFLENFIDFIHSIKVKNLKTFEYSFDSVFTKD